MILTNNINIDNQAINYNLTRIINQIYKLLPNREENIDWQTPLATILEELSGMCKLMGVKQQQILFSLLCKLNGLYDLTFHEYRRTIFECLNLVQQLKESIEVEYE